MNRKGLLKRYSDSEISTRRIRKAFRQLAAVKALKVGMCSREVEAREEKESKVRAWMCSL